jgi:hypothetical protein
MTTRDSIEGFGGCARVSRHTLTLVTDADE